MYKDVSGTAALMTTNGNLIILNPSEAPKLFIKPTYSGIEDATTLNFIEKDCAYYVMHRQKDYPPFEIVDENEDFIVLKGTYYTVYLTSRGTLILSPIDPCNWISIVRTRELQNSLSHNSIPKYKPSLLRRQVQLFQRKINAGRPALYYN